MSIQKEHGLVRTALLLLLLGLLDLGGLVADLTSVSEGTVEFTLHQMLDYLSLGRKRKVGWACRSRD